MVEGREGRPGAGKTLSLIWNAWKLKQKGRAVYANIPLIDMRTKYVKREFFGPRFRMPHCSTTYGKSWSDGPILQTLGEALALDNALVLLDEVHMWVSSDRWNEVPFEVRQYLAQQRKIGIDIWWTAQHNGRVFNVIRQLTACLWSCVRYGPLIVMQGKDPETKEDFGRRYMMVGAETYELYNTEYMVGDGAGSEGRYGRNERYAKRRGDGVLLGPEPPSYAYMRREELPDGRVCYVRDEALVQWWKDHRSGLDVGPSPLAAGTEGAGVPAVQPPATLATERRRPGRVTEDELRRFVDPFGGAGGAVPVG